MMNKQTREEFIKWARNLANEGYTKAPMFCFEKGVTPEELIKTLTHPMGEPTREQTLIAFGGLTWAFAQLAENPDEP